MLLTSHRLTACFRAIDPVRFPELLPTNVIRGALGYALREVACRCGAGEVHRPDCVYQRWFEPVLEHLPSQRAALLASIRGEAGAANLPRPFVLRGVTAPSTDPAEERGELFVRQGQEFEISLAWFDLEHLDQAMRVLRETFAHMGQAGMGPNRGRAELLHFEAAAEPVRVSLDLPEADAPITRIRVSFETPVEIKFRGAIAKQLDLPLLVNAAARRINTLRTLYDPGTALEQIQQISSLAEGAYRADLVRSDLHPVNVDRRSSRTGQVHSLGGLVGEVEFRAAEDNDLARPSHLLQAAADLGIGRHTSWGNGRFCVLVRSGTDEGPKSARGS